MLVTHDTDNDIKYNQLYSVYSYPNLILPFLGGILIDKAGLKFATILFSSLLIIGQGVFMISGFMGTENQSNSFPFYVALTGRFIFGLGGESLDVCQNTISSKWFMGKELSLSFAVNTSIASIGTVTNNYSMPPIANSTSLGFALLVGLFLCVFALVWSVILALFHNKNKNSVKKEGSNESETEEFRFSDIKHFSVLFWLIALNWLFIYVGILWFNNISNDFFVIRYGLTQTNAGRITSNIYLISIFWAPIFGIVMDKIGYKIIFCLFANGLVTIWHILFIIIPSSTPDNISYLGIIPIVLMGISYSIYVPSFWSMVPLAVKPQVVGTAFGVWLTVTNIACSFGPFMVGGLTFFSMDENAYVYASLSLAICWALGFLTWIGIFILDLTSYQGMLLKPSIEALNNEIIHSEKSSPEYLNNEE